jgi:hypothetical protein
VADGSSFRWPLQSLLSVQRRLRGKGTLEGLTAFLGLNRSIEAHAREVPM